MITGKYIDIDSIPIRIRRLFGLSDLLWPEVLFSFFPHSLPLIFLFYLSFFIFLVYLSCPSFLFIFLCYLTLMRYIYSSITFLLYIIHLPSFIGNVYCYLYIADAIAAYGAHNGIAYELVALTHDFRCTGTVLYCSILYCIVLFCFVMYCIILFCCVLGYLHYIVLNFIILYSNLL